MKEMSHLQSSYKVAEAEERVRRAVEEWWPGTYSHAKSYYVLQKCNWLISLTINPDTTKEDLFEQVRKRKEEVQEGVEDLFYKDLVNVVAIAVCKCIHSL